MRPISESQQAAVDLAVEAYQDQITDEAIEWLEGRGLDLDAVVTNRLGVVGAPEPGHGKFEGWLSIPYLDKDDRALTVRFRCIESDCTHKGHGKYQSISGDRGRMYGVGAIHRASSEIHVCEGEFDAMVLNSIDLPAVALPGASFWRNHHRRMLAGFSRVWLWCDPDEAGSEMTNRLMRAMPQALPVRLPGLDVSDTYICGGAEALYELLEDE